MLQCSPFKALSLSIFREHVLFLQPPRYFSSKYDKGFDAEDLDAARAWFATFSENTIPAKIATTTFSQASGAGGQKTNKTSSKATTVWPVDLVKAYVPRVLQTMLRDSRYYVSSSDSFTIQCDAQRNRSQNKDETHRRLNAEIRHMYNSTVPGVTAPEQSRKVEQLKKAENATRLKMKKLHSDKKNARKGGSRNDL